MRLAVPLCLLLACCRSSDKKSEDHNENAPGGVFHSLDRSGSQGFGLVRRVRLPRRGSRYRIDVNLPAGTWELRTRYVDKGIVAPGASRVRSVSVP